MRVTEDTVTQKARYLHFTILGVSNLVTERLHIIYTRNFYVYFGDIGK